MIRTSTKLNLDMDDFPLQPKNTLKLRLGVISDGRWAGRAPIIFVFSVRNLLLVSLLARRILRSLVGFWKICGRSVRVGDRRGAYSVLVGRHDGKRTLGSPRRRWKDIKIIFKKWNGGGGHMQWIDVPQSRDRW